MADSYVPIFFDWPEATRELKTQEKGRLIDAIVLYARGSGEWSDLIEGNERYVFPMFQAQIERARAERDADRENGRKGGRPRKNPGLNQKPRLSEKNPGFELKTPVSDEKPKEYNNEYNNEYYMGNLDEEEDINNDIPMSPARRAVVRAWRENFGRVPNPAITGCIDRWITRFDMEDAVAVEAVSMAALRDAADPVGYIVALLKDWHGRGIKTSSQLDDYLEGAEGE